MGRTSALIVDDDEFVASVLAQQLQQMGFTRIERAHNGAEALRMLAAERPYDLTFCDLQMPELDGIGFLREVAHQGLAPDIILMSGLGSALLQSAAGIAASRDLRILGVLEKPIRSDQLRKLVESSFDETPAPPSSVLSSIVTEELRSAIARDEISIAVQPRISVSGGGLIAAEILPRWRHPCGITLPAGRFQQLAEKSGLMEKLLELLLHKAIAVQKAWAAQGLKIQIVIPMPVRCLAALELPDQLAACAEGQGMGPWRITLEIVGADWMPETKLCIDTLVRLRMKGFALGLGDFGAGEACFARLVQGPFSALRIDSSFVAMLDEAADDPGSMSVVESHVRLACTMGIGCVADGVATRAQYDELARMHCDQVQGSFIGVAMAPDALPGWWRRRARDGTASRGNNAG